MNATFCHLHEGMQAGEVVLPCICKLDEMSSTTISSKYTKCLDDGVIGGPLEGGRGVTPRMHYSILI